MSPLPCLLLAGLVPLAVTHQRAEPKAHVLVLYENGGHHVEYTKRARVWLDELAAKKHLAIDYIQTTRR